MLKIFRSLLSSRGSSASSNIVEKHNSSLKGQENVKKIQKHISILFSLIFLFTILFLGFLNYKISINPKNVNPNPVQDFTSAVLDLYSIIIPAIFISKSFK